MLNFYLPYLPLSQKTINTFCVHAQHIWCLPLTPYVLGIKTLRKDSKNEFIHGDMVHLL